MLRIGVTSPDRGGADVVVGWWQRPRSDRWHVRVGVVPWPVDDEAAARAHLVIAVGSRSQSGADGVDTWITPDEADALWDQRIAPFAANLLDGRRAPRARVARLVGPDPHWPAQARRLIARIRGAAGDHLLRIDHIGSTSIPGLPAKDVIDIQAVVADLDAAEAVASIAAECGLVDAGMWDLPDRMKTRYVDRVLVDADPGRPTTVNLRPVGDPIWRETLLYRDWLRSDRALRDAYLAEKQRLALSTEHVDAYGDGKVDWISAALTEAETWAALTGWAPE